jgi:hypothetical protein
MKVIIKKYENLQEDWKEVMLQHAKSGSSFCKLYTSVALTRRYHEVLLSDNEDYRDHFEFCKDIIHEYWITMGKELIFDRNANSATYSLVMRNMFGWEKTDATSKKETTPQHTASPSDDDELEKFKTKKTPAPTELKVINK